MEHCIRKKFSDEEKKAILSKSNSKCAHCGKKLTVHTMTIEHMYPIDKGGDNSEYNIIALCDSCNKNKNNFVYDMSYFIFLKSDEYKKYKKELLTNIYKNINDSHILGKSNSIVTVVDGKYMGMLKKRSSRNIQAVKMLGKQYELRELMCGDIDDEVAELASSNFMYEDTGEEAKANKYGLINLAKEATMYGLYYANNLKAVFAYINIKKLNVEDSRFTEELQKLNYDETYVEVLRAYKDRDSFICDRINDKIVEFMAFTNNLVILTNTCTDASVIIANNLRNMISTAINLPANINYMHEAYFELTLYDNNYNNIQEAVDYYRDYFNVSKEE